MRATHKNLLEQFTQMAVEGKFGDSITASQREYDQVPMGIGIMLKVVEDFYHETASHDSEIARIRSLMCQLLIVAYREARRKNPDAALPFVYSFIEDYPGVPQSSLLPRWVSLGHACLAFREVASSKNRILMWQQTCKQFQAYNEFLNGLISYLIIMWRISLGKPINTGVFDTNYASKVDQFKSLTGGEDGPFYLFVRIARPRIRNAIAHESIWLDSNAVKVRYTEGRSHKRESELDLVEFTALASTGSHLPHAYLAAIAVIVTMEAGTEHAKSLLPPQVVRLFNHAGPNSA